MSVTSAIFLFKKYHQNPYRHHLHKKYLLLHLTLLEELGYLDGESITPRGRIARMLSGYELQMTELLFRGVLENLPARALAMVAVAMIHEERRGIEPAAGVASFDNVRRSVTGLVGELCAAEVHHGIEPGMKQPDWGLVRATLAWYDGAGIEELEQDTGVNPGDVCRVFRMSIQLLRNLRRATEPEWDLHERLSEAIEAMNRDEIDARRQLELG